MELLRDVANTIDLKGGTDEWAAPGGDGPAALRARDWLRQHALWPAEARALTRADYEELLAFRGDLRDLIQCNGEHRARPPALAAVNAALARAPVRVVLQEGGEDARLEPAQRGMAGVIATFAAAIYDSMADGTWPRLKLCAASSCRWAFYDGSRNRAGTWCSMAMCGNRAKVRTYRARQRAR